MRIKKIDGWLFRSFIPPFIVTFMIATFVLLMQILWLYIDDLAGKGLSIFLVVELLAYKCVSLVPLALPLAILISSLMVLGNLAEHYELSSLKSAGIPLLRIMRSILFFGLGAMVLSYLCSNYFIPVANLKFGSRMWDIQRQKPTLSLDAKVFNYDFDGFVIHIGEKGKDGRRIEDVLIYDHSGSAQDGVSEIMAREGEMFSAEDGKYFVMRLLDGHQYMEAQPTGKGTFPFVRTSFREWVKVFDLSEFQLTRTDEELFKSNRTMLSSGQLREAMDSIEMKIEQRREGVVKYLSNFYAPVRRDDQQLPIRQVQAKDVEAGQGKLAGRLDTLPRQQEEPPMQEGMGPPERSYEARRYALPDSISSFDQLLTGLPRYRRKSYINKAQTFARSILNQTQSANRTIADLAESHVKHEYDMHMKYSMAVICILFVLIGAPMGAIIRKGGFGYPILVAILFFMLFIILTIFCRKIAESFIVPAWAAAWIPCMIFLPLGLRLTFRAMNDSKLLDVDRYVAPLRRLFKKRKKKNDHAATVAG